MDSKTSLKDNIMNFANNLIDAGATYSSIISTCGSEVIYHSTSYKWDRIYHETGYSKDC
ncbi:MAG: hypothetical protein K0R94_1508, partial [Burkholderiales bacterium]|nr:hypothetical protein [Burkholderiales bacterium]